MYAVIVKKENAEQMIKKLEKGKHVDHARKIELTEGSLIIPVTGYINEPGISVVEYEGSAQELKVSPFQRIRSAIEIPEHLKELLPERWERYGSVLVLRYPRVLDEYRDRILPVYARVLNVRTILNEKGKIHDIMRVPDMELMYGTETETIHIENGIKYKFDVARIMFSSGNVNERIRMGSIDVSSETIVDMFAGIGYFSLPLAKYQAPKKIYACEINPVAFKYLIENIKLNGIENIEPYLGDNLTFDRARANRVLMGYIDTERFLPKALSLLEDGRGTIHFHNTWTTEELKSRDIILRRYARDYGFSYQLLYFSVIKSYAPHIWHVVADLKIL